MKAERIYQHPQSGNTARGVWVGYLFTPEPSVKRRWLKRLRRLLRATP